MIGDLHKSGSCLLTGESFRIRDEFRLLLLCARTRVEPQQREQIRTLVVKPLDWEFIQEKANSHALIPLLYRNLSECCADLVPPAAIQQLESVYTANAKRNLALTTELIQVLRILESAGISVVPHKGPALAGLTYGDIKLRKFFDLDLIIRPRDIVTAKSLLVSHGYQWRPMQGQLTGRREARNFRLWHEYNFINTVNRTNIDLHWRISSRRFPTDVDLDALWEGLKPAILLEEEILSFPPEVLLVFLCIHGSKDLWWRRIGWICDIAELVAANPELDWSYGLELATQIGARRMLLLGLALAHELLQAPLPEMACAWIRSEHEVLSLTDDVRRRLFDEPIIRHPNLEKQRFRLRVRERLRDRIPIYQHSLEIFIYKAFVPNIEDRKLITLPGSLSALYYLVKPVRLAHKFWSHTIRRGRTTP